MEINIEKIYYLDCEEKLYDTFCIIQATMESCANKFNICSDTVLWQCEKNLSRKKLFYTFGYGVVYCTEQDNIKNIIKSHQCAENVTKNIPYNIGNIVIFGNNTQISYTIATFKNYGEEMYVILKDNNGLTSEVKFTEFLNKFSKIGSKREIEIEH